MKTVKVASNSVRLEFEEDGSIYILRANMDLYQALTELWGLEDMSQLDTRLNTPTMGDMRDILHASRLSDDPAAKQEDTAKIFRMLGPAAFMSTITSLLEGSRPPADEQLPIPPATAPTKAPNRKSGR